VSVLSLLGDVVARLRDVDPSALSGDDCARLVAQLATVEKACAGLRARAAVRAKDCGAHRAAGFADPTEWLARATGSTRAVARETMDTAAALVTCGPVADAMAAGELSLTQAKEILAAETEQPGCARDLLHVARTESMARLKERARDVRLRGMDPDELHRKQHAATDLRWFRDDLGMVRIGVALPPEIGIPIVHRLDVETDRIFRRARRSGRTERREVYAAEALVAMLESGTSKPNRTRAEVVFVVDVASYRQRRVVDGGTSHIVAGGPVPVSVIDEAIDNGAFVKAVLHDGVQIQRVKHFTRGYKAELRTALELGPAPAFDGLACVDCGARFRPELDHVDPLGHGGATEFDNITPRCAGCHRAKTERDRTLGLLHAQLRRRIESNRRARAHDRAPP